VLVKNVSWDFRMGNPKRRSVEAGSYARLSRDTFFPFPPRVRKADARKDKRGERGS